jgi:hypothetical protein
MTKNKMLCCTVNPSNPIINSDSVEAISLRKEVCIIKFTTKNNSFYYWEYNTPSQAAQAFQNIRGLRFK